MVTVLGNATTGYATDPVHVDLPRADANGGVRRAHRPWCCDCKRTFDTDQLDTDGRCAQCARAAVTRAAAAARRAAQEQAAAPPPAPRPAVAKKKPAKAVRRAPRPAPARPTRVPPTTTRPNTGHLDRKSGPDRIELPEDDVAAAYRSGRTLAQIGETYGVSHMTIARVLDDAGVPRRGARVPITDDLADKVRRLYLDRGLTQAEIATEIGYSPKVVQRVMAERNIHARPAVARSGANRASSLKEQANALAVRGITVRDVKVWAIEQGLLEQITRGLPAQRIVTAYLDAHPAEPGTPVETTTRQVAAALVGLRTTEAVELARRLVAGDTIDLGPLTVREAS